MIIGGGGLTATVDPARGAKITSLVDAQGVQWLAQGTGVEVPAGAAFTDAEMAGWDECAPSIVACEVGGRVIPDHGELWDSVFEATGSTVCRRGDGYLFERTIEPTETGLRFRYEATATEGALPFLWAAHPQFVAPPGTRIALPQQVARVVDVTNGDVMTDRDMANGEVVTDGTPTLRWDEELATIDTVEDGGSRKLYVDPATPVFEASLVRPDGATLSMHWSPESPYLGLWYDNRAWSRKPVIALEPSTGYYDSLARALASSRVAIIDPGHPLRWWLEVGVSGPSGIAQASS